MKIYGIPNCSTVRSARKFFKDNNIELEFIDIKKTDINCTDIDRWLKDVDIDTLFNNRGTTYRTLKLKELNLDSDGKREWLCKENMLLKRPIIELGSKTIVGFNEELYKTMFL